MKHAREILLSLATSLVLMNSAQAQPRQPAHQSVWDGVYSEEQAARGQTLFQQSCARCHGANLSGTFETPPLVGRFIPYWAGTTLDVLFDYVSTAMPLDRPGSLSPRANTDIVAFMLKANGFPAGTKELSTDNQKTINFDAVQPPRKKSARPR